ncbi:MAG: hypothetical protein F9K19_16695 [Rhizobiaceae bacterium]|nr:MAG: hypothetical protein F9K19_16695 [Rhizobiaceae bacterium]CAG0967314.1 hypothetical protein RHIZO_01032 [Rhizobiaceae bacterium]
MIRQPHTAVREMIVAKAIEEVASELRLVDIADYVAYIRLERFAAIADIVDSASELFFMPGTLCFGHGGSANVDWSGNPEILLDMQLKPGGVTVYFTLKLANLTAAVDVNYVAFEESSDDPEENSRFLETAIAAARLKTRRSEAPRPSAAA